MTIKKNQLLLYHKFDNKLLQTPPATPSPLAPRTTPAPLAPRATPAPQAIRDTIISDVAELLFHGTCNWKMTI